MAQFNAGAKLCREDMQGIGKQTRGTCNDVALSIKKPAPVMVVVPPPSLKDAPYAIGKYEVSIEQLNHFCATSKTCSTVKSSDDQLPAMNVPTKVIEDYAKWLSKETGFQYSIATHEQWLNAAKAGGREGNSDYNCRLRLGTKLIKGQNIVQVKSGAANNWGLINYVGNVDEIVVNDKGYTVVGGNYADSISDCKITLEKPFKPNLVTAGFRLVRDLN